MSKNSYPKVPWRTVKDPIAGHPRTYENGIKLDWYTTEAPAGSYRSIFKWGNPKEYKVPSEGMFNYMMKKLDFTPEFLNSKKNFGDSPVKYEIKSQLSVEEHKALLAFVAGDGADDDYTRLRVAYGQTMIDLMRLREGIVENVPDLVLYPSTTEQIENIVKYCDDHKIAIYVYSGGSSVTRGVEPTVKRSITLDLGKNFNKIISVNEINETVTVQPGIFGTALEAYLNNPDNFKSGNAYTVGHFPQSFEYSTVGGWVVTRGAGQNSCYYGKIEDLVLTQQYVTPVGTFRTERAPRKATGPDINQIMMGSEGTFGILTEVTLKLHRRSRVQKPFCYLSRDWDSGVAFMRDVMQAERGVPSVFRISDGEESDLGLRMYGLGKIEGLLKTFGLELGKCCLIVGFCDGDPDYQRMTIRNVKKNARKHHLTSFLPGIVVPKWSSGRFSDPYMRDNYQDFGVIIDTLECAMPWDEVDHIHDYVRKFIKSHPNVICTCHISHCYQNGANLYFIWMQKDEGIEKFKEFHSGVLNAIQESGASISHHHGIGKLFAPYNAKQLGDVQMDMLKALKHHFDPNGIMNPGGTLWLDK